MKWLFIRFSIVRHRHIKVRSGLVKKTTKTELKLKEKKYFYINEKFQHENAKSK